MFMPLLTKPNRSLRDNDLLTLLERTDQYILHDGHIYLRGMEIVHSSIPRDRSTSREFICLMDVLWLPWRQGVTVTDVVVGH